MASHSIARSRWVYGAQWYAPVKEVLVIPITKKETLRGNSHREVGLSAVIAAYPWPEEFPTVTIELSACWRGKGSASS